MITFDEALALLAGAVQPLAAEEVALVDADGRVLAEPVHAALDAPRRAVSAMDGYALRDVDAAIGARLRVIGQSFAGGELPPPLGASECVRIFTGAALPVGADRVVMQENCTAEADLMTIAREYGPGWHVRAAGSDFHAGDVLLEAGRLLDPGAIVTLAGADRGSALVYRAPAMAIIATGDELAPPGTARGNPLAIPESVSFGVAALARQHGARIAARLTGGDDLGGLKALAGQALDRADVVVVTGGASVGERDFAKAMFGDHGLDLLFPKVAIRPGKPVWLGRTAGRWVLGLPGNPTSAMVTARLFLVPLLTALQGRAIGEVLDWEARPSSGALPATGDRMTFWRARAASVGLEPVSNQDSGAQATLAAARWLIRTEPGEPPVRPGQIVQALRL
ncbi:molybdopterin molybdotransferase MoeA [Novosphingobium sp.]|uniref:molybdopterin molybdotransferase MoeA n=1 Tax=Novosphingobium sp. TaxID=1874826 RepID=UPI0027347C82|nr:molybdopterin molybdotransferase MoeA [Novosphingobium sp.]MDP3907806.1 molybdopterin molybdotransferase MoeA [Novosphingobium sp.]